MNEAYPSGPDLSHYFPKPEKPLSHTEVQALLPAEFDDSCKKCHEPMQCMFVHYCTRQNPFATFQCPKCKIRLFLFKAPVTPLLVWSDSFVYATTFSDMIDERIAEREQKRKVRALREHPPV